MPIYEYQCQNCRHQFEIMQRISDPVLKKCPECGKLKLRKLLSAVAFRLKGGGWYETDFKSGDKKKNVLGSDSDDRSSKEKAEPSEKADKKEADGAAKKKEATSDSAAKAKSSKSPKPKKESSD